MWLLGRVRIGLVAAGVALTMTSLTASASGEDPVTADALFREAKARMAKGEVARACTLFAESQRLDPAPGTLLNLADCEEKNGRFATARQLFVRASESLPSSDERVAYALRRAKELEPRVASIVLRVPQGAPAGVRVVMDGTTWSAASFGIPLPIDPGDHVLDVRADGHVPRPMQISLASGEAKTVDVVWGSPVTSPPRPAPVNGDAVVGQGTSPEEPSSSGRRTAGYVIGGAGLVALAVGAVTGVMVIGYANTYADHCKPDCDEEGRRAAERGKPFNVLSPVLLGLGAVGTGVGLYLLLSDEPSGPRTSMSMTPNGVLMTTTF